MWSVLEKIRRIEGENLILSFKHHTAPAAYLRHSTSWQYISLVAFCPWAVWIYVGWNLKLATMCTKTCTLRNGSLAETGHTKHKYLSSNAFVALLVNFRCEIFCEIVAESPELHFWEIQPGCSIFFVASKQWRRDKLWASLLRLKKNLLFWTSST